MSKSYTYEQAIDTFNAWADRVHGTDEHTGGIRRLINHVAEEVHELALAYCNEMGVRATEDELADLFNGVARIAHLLDTDLAFVSLRKSEWLNAQTWAPTPSGYMRRAGVNGNMEKGEPRDILACDQALRDMARAFREWQETGLPGDHIAMITNVGNYLEAMRA